MMMALDCNDLTWFVKGYLLFFAMDVLKDVSIMYIHHQQRVLFPS